MDDATIAHAALDRETSWQRRTPPVTALAMIISGLLSTFLIPTLFMPGCLFAFAFLLTARPSRPFWVGGPTIFILLSTGAYILAWMAATNPRSFVRPFITSIPGPLQGTRHDTLRGMLAGSVGGMGLAIAFILTYRIRQLWRIAAVLLLVPLTGLFLGIAFFHTKQSFIAFPVWQGGVGFVMAMLNPGAMGWRED